MKRKIILILVLVIAAVFPAGCQIKSFLFPEQKIEIDTGPVLDIDLDQRQLAMIETIDDNLETTYQIKGDVDISHDIRNPFQPYYIQQNQENENTIKLEKIYSQDGVDYAEIKFNEFSYKLVETDVFAEIYKVQAINENSVVLLKGDEIITIFLDQLILD